MSFVRRLSALLPALVLIVGAAAPAAALTPQKSAAPLVPAMSKHAVAGRWVAFVRPGTTRSVLSTMATSQIRAAGATPRTARGATWFAFAGSDAVAAKVAKLPGVVRIARDLQMKAFAWPDDTQTPNDAGYESLWGIADMHVEDAWAHTRGAGVTVAVVDTGIKATHPDIAGASFANGYDVVNGMAMPVSQKAYWPESTEIPHGTHVAGTIAAVADNEIGVAGVAPEATLMPVRVIDGSGGGTLSDVSYGIEWAGAHGADVINLSIGGTFYASEYDMLMEMMGPAIDSATDTGAVIVAASGNDGIDEAQWGATTWPADHPRVIRVGAHEQTSFVDSEDVDGDGDTTETLTSRSVAYFSNAADTVTVTAPGVDVLSTEANSSWYERWAGTSMATPHVAGIAALIKAVRPSFTPAKIKALIAASASDSNLVGGSMGYAAGRDDSSGAGAIDAAKAFDVIENNARVIGVELSNPARRVIAAGGRIVPVRVTAFGGAATCTLQVRVYNTDGVRRGATGVLPGTTCGLRSIGYAAVMAATGTSIPNNTGGYAVEVIASNGAAKSSLRMSVVGYDTIAPTIGAFEVSGAPTPATATTPWLTTRNFTATATIADAFARDPNVLYDRIDMAVKVVFSGGQSRTYPSLNALIVEYGATLTDWVGNHTMVENAGAVTITGSYDYAAIRTVADIVYAGLTSECANPDDCAYATSQPVYMEMRLRTSDGTQAASGSLLKVRRLIEADTTVLSTTWSWIDSTETEVGGIGGAGCAAGEYDADYYCGSNDELTGGAIAHDWVAVAQSGATYTFVGRGGRLTLYSSVGPDYGTFTVTVDGVLLGTVNIATDPATRAKATGIRNGVVVFDKTFGAGAHTVVLTTTSAKLVGLDALYLGPR